MLADPGGAVVVASTGSSLVTPAIVAAIVAAAVAMTTFVLAGRRAQVDRQRQLFADAFEAVALYKEYPFIVRRRRPDDAAGERVRISGELSELQAKLASLRARVKVEAPEVGKHYEALVATTRRIAGGMIHDAWNEQPVGEDGQMHSPGFDFSEIEAAEIVYLGAVADHLSFLSTPLARWWRTRRSG